MNAATNITTPIPPVMNAVTQSVSSNTIVSLAFTLCRDFANERGWGDAELGWLGGMFPVFSGIDVCMLYHGRV